MSVTITAGLQNIINEYCRAIPPQLFEGSEHRGALIAIEYKGGYLSNMTIPNRLFAEAITPNTKENLYLLANPDIIIVPYFQNSNGFNDDIEFYLTAMKKELPYLPFLLLISGEDYKLYKTSTKAQEELYVIDNLPVHLTDKIKEFLFEKDRLINTED